MRRLIVLTVVLAIALVASGALWMRTYLGTSLAIPEEGHALTIESGTSWSKVVGSLAADGVVRAPAILTAWGRFTGQAARLKAGEYRLEPGLTPPGLLAQLVAGKVVLHKLTLVEGWSVRDILRALRDQPTLTQSLAAADAEQLALELELPWTSAEGAFLPETYLYPRGMTDRELLLRAHDALETHLGLAWESRRSGLPLATPYELLILASIVERETALARERPQIAGVFVRRLERGMRLQTDPTVIYGLGLAFDGNLTRRHLETDSPWNTYTRHGLPPTPIATASAASIDASAHPADGTTLFFVATGAGDGSHRFTDTLREHQAAVRDYLAALRRRNDGPGNP